MLMAVRIKKKQIFCLVHTLLLTKPKQRETEKHT